VTPPPIAATGATAGATLAIAASNVPAPLPSPSARLVAAGSVMAASAMTAMLTVRYMRVSLVWKAHRSTPQPRAGSIRSLLWLIRLPRRSRLRPTARGAASGEANQKERTVSRLGLFVALAVCFAAGYVLAGFWSRARDTTPLAQICARVDYVNSLQENLKGQDAASEDARGELKRLVEQCRTALRDRAEESD
jgi:uncharacterized membrane protein